MLLRKSLLIRAALLTSSTRPLIKNYNFLTLPWSHMMSPYMAFPANKYPPGATSTSISLSGRNPNQNHPHPLPYCRCANILQHPPGPSFPQYTWRSRLHPSLGHEVPCPIRRHPDHTLRPALGTRMLHGHIERPPDSSIVLSGEDLDPRIGRDVCLKPIEDTSPLELPNGHSINLGTGLNSDERATITPILINNIDLFAWSTADLPGVDPQVASHKLSIYKEACYVSQKKRKLGEEHRQAAKVEADKLLSAGFTKEAQYTTWLLTLSW